MRQTELASGVDLRDEKGRRVCKSKYAARKGIGQVRVTHFSPLVYQYIDNRIM